MSKQRIEEKFEKGWAKTFISSLVRLFNPYKARQVSKQRIKEKNFEKK